MAKIGRNDPCPCGSGRKFKRCCLGKQQEASTNLTEVQQAQISLQNAINTTEGDGWLLEVSQSDALQVAAAKEILTVDFEENPETIEINWTHTFKIKDKQFVITAYKDKKVTVIENYPTHPISAAIKRIKKRYSAELLESVHIDQEQAKES